MSETQREKLDRLIMLLSAKDKKGYLLFKPTSADSRWSYLTYSEHSQTLVRVGPLFYIRELVKHIEKELEEKEVEPEVTFEEALEITNADYQLITNPDYQSIGNSYWLRLQQFMKEEKERRDAKAFEEKETNKEGAREYHPKRTIQEG